jgi:hypothetical protein
VSVESLGLSQPTTRPQTRLQRFADRTAGDTPNPISLWLAFADCAMARLSLPGCALPPFIDEAA